MPSFNWATSAINFSAAAWSSLFLAAPISRASALRRASADSALRIAERRRSSIAIRAPACGGSRRLARARSNASGFSRIHLMSCIATRSRNPALVIAESLTVYAACESKRAPCARPGSLGRVRFGGSIGGGVGGRGRQPFFDQINRPDRALVEGQQRHRKRQLAEHV